MAKRKASQLQADENYNKKAPLVSFRLPSEYYDKVEQLAEQHGVNKAEMFRHLIIESLSQAPDS